jgi:type IV pilus assembly protein PilA
MLNNIKTKDRGFTIVELLIVIVVIAILAAISIVAYNGIQNRSKTSAGQALASQIAKKVEAYYTLAGTYPNPGADLAAGTLDDYPESTVDNTAALGTQATGAAVSGQSATVANNGTVVTSWGCAAGANVWYWDYSTSAAVAVEAGAGC